MKKRRNENWYWTVRIGYFRFCLILNGIKVWYEGRARERQLNRISNSNHNYPFRRALQCILHSIRIPPSDWPPTVPSSWRDKVALVRHLTHYSAFGVIYSIRRMNFIIHTIMCLRVIVKSTYILYHPHFTVQSNQAAISRIQRSLLVYAVKMTNKLVRKK